MSELRCHRCSHFIGESSRPMEFVGIFKSARDRERLPDPRDTWVCKSCGWANCFRVAEKSWRTVELKGPDKAA